MQLFNRQLKHETIHMIAKCMGDKLKHPPTHLTVDVPAWLLFDFVWLVVVIVCLFGCVRLSGVLWQLIAVYGYYFEQKKTRTKEAGKKGK